MQRYLHQSLPELACRIASATQNQTLARVFCLPKKHHSKPAIEYYLGEKMEDAAYSKLVSEIRQCRFARDKVKIIQDNIRSMVDMEELLQDANLNQQETFAVLRLLDTADLAAMYQRHLLGIETKGAAITPQEMEFRENLLAHILTRNNPL